MTQTRLTLTCYKKLKQIFLPKIETLQHEIYHLCKETQPHS